MTAGTVEECDYLLGMIGAMLDIAEVQAGGKDLEHGTVDLAERARNETP